MSTGKTKTDRQTEKQTDRKTDRKREKLFSLVIKTKVAQNVSRMPERQKDNRMSKGRTDRMILDRAPGRQTKQQIKRQNYILTDRMTV